MADEGARLVATLEARITKFERDLAKANATANRQFGAIERRAEQAGARLDKTAESMAKRVNSRLSQIGSGLGSIGSKFAGGFVGAAGVSTLIKYTDAYLSMANQLKVAGLEGTGLQSVFSSLANSAKANFAPLASLVTLYGRAAQASKELGASQSDLLAFTDNVAKALRVAGSSPEAASGTLLQLSQLLGSARVQAEEFNSVNEGARPILQAVADGVIEAGGSVSKLKQLVTDGEVSNRAFFEAFQIGAQKLDEKLAGTTTTVSGAMENLKTTLTEVAGRFESGSQSTALFVAGLKDVEKAVRDLGAFFEDIAGPLRKVGEGLDFVKAKLDAAAIAAGRFTGLDNVGRELRELSGETDVSQIADDLDTTAKSAERLEDKAKRLQQEIASLSANRLTLDTSRLQDARSELEDVRRALEAVHLAKDRLYGDPSKAIVQASPAPQPPAVTSDDVMRQISAPARTAPISVKDFPVQSSDGGSAKKLEGLTTGFGTSLQQLIAAAKAAGHDITVFSGRRTVERQAQLWQEAVKKYGSEAEARRWVAPPGRSMHNAGKAADLRYGSEAARLFAHQNASSYGLTFPLGNEPWHIESAGARSPEDRQRTETESLAERRRKAVADSIADLEREREAIGKTAEQQRVLQEIQQAGVDINSAEGQQIQAKVAALYALKDAQDVAEASATKLREAQQQVAEVGADATKSFVAELRNGASAADALKAALDRIVDRLLDSAINSLFQNLVAGPGSGGGGLLAGVGALFGGGRADGGPVDAGKAYLVGEKRPELFVPGRSGTIVPKIPTIAAPPPIARATSAQSSVSPVVRMQIDLRGANGDATIERISKRAAAQAGQEAYRAAMRDSARATGKTQYRREVLGQDY